MTYIVYDDYNEIWEEWEADSPEEAAEIHSDQHGHGENTEYTIYEIGDKFSVEVAEELTTNFVLTRRH